MSMWYCRITIVVHHDRASTFMARTMGDVDATWADRDKPETRGSCVVDSHLRRPALAIATVVLSLAGTPCSSHLPIG